MSQACCTTAQNLTCYNTDLIPLFRGVFLGRTICLYLNEFWAPSTGHTTTRTKTFKDASKPQRAATAQESKTISESCFHAQRRIGAFDPKH